MKPAHYYEIATAPNCMAVVADDDITIRRVCAACAERIPVGASLRWTSLSDRERVLGRSQVAVSRAPREGLTCERCDAEIAPEMCQGGYDFVVGDYDPCGLPLADCVCAEHIEAERADALAYRPERMAGGGWLQ